MYFSDYFQIARDTIEDYGAMDVSLVSDLPLFIDPFLLFNSDQKKYEDLHDGIIKYLAFLRDIAKQGNLSEPLLESWFYFKEVKQTWLGFSMDGNAGSGLGSKFAESLSKNLNLVFSDFGNEAVTRGSHLEKLCLIRAGVGRDNISDFTTNLIKRFLLEFTDEFTRTYVSEADRGTFGISRVEFNYQTQSWMPRSYVLPRYGNDYVILSPTDILTKDETWISRSDLVHRFERIPESVTDSQLRAQLNDYLARTLPEAKSQRHRVQILDAAIRRFPRIIDYYIKQKEDTGDDAVSLSKDNVEFTKRAFQVHVESFAHLIKDFFRETTTPATTYTEAMTRVRYLKQVIEHNDGYKLFYVDGDPVKKESDLQLLFRLTWFKTVFDVNAEVNNGRGPVDYKISNGFTDKTLVEFKLARNRKLKQNLMNQLRVYEEANQTEKSIKVILYFTADEIGRVQEMLSDLNLEDDGSIVLIDARKDNKPSASVA